MGIGTATSITRSKTLTAGRDTINFDTSLGPITDTFVAINGALGTGDYLNGGSGWDTLKWSITGKYSAQPTLVTIKPTLVSIETLELSIGDMSAATTLDMAASASCGLKHLKLVGGPEHSFAADFTLRNLNSKLDTIATDNFDGRLSIESGATAVAGNADRVTINSSHTVNVALPGYEIVDLVTGVADVVLVHRLHLTESRNPETLNIRGSASEVRIGSPHGVDVIDASTFGGKLRVLNDSWYESGATSLTIRGGFGSDSIRGTSLDDIIQAAPKDATSQTDRMWGGAGRDVFRFEGSTLERMLDVSRIDAGAKPDYGGSAVRAGMARIEDFQCGIDRIALAWGGAGKHSINVTKEEWIATASSFDQIALRLGDMAASTPTEVKATVVTVAGGTLAGTYLVVNDTNSGFKQGDDMVIDLTGMTGTLRSTDFIFT
ncbi:bluetail domain-containing putative surface protein [Ramlibacter sp.]|uniref:bluetail domain-containing putative surface protein n=1 Tax=Ramlibacter sp. TaxID=1917967 RepID=UPI003D0FDC5C